MTAQVYTTPAFRNVGGTWRPIEPELRATHDPAYPFEATGLPRRIRLGADARRLASLDLDHGSIVVSAPSLHVGRPALARGRLTYRDVAKDTDLRTYPTAVGLEQEMVLRSATSPQEYTFHLADPRGLLGTPRALPGGGVRFSTPAIGGHPLEILPPVAYDAAGASTDGGSSVSVTVRAAGDGYDVVERIDGRWLRGRRFPVVLDPTYSLTGPATTVDCGIDASTAHQFVPQCGAGEAIAGVAPGAKLLPTEPDAWVRHRYLVRFDLTSLPAGAHVVAGGATLVLDVAGSNGPGSLSLQTPTQAWTTGATWWTTNGAVPWTTTGGSPDGVTYAAKTISAGMNGPLTFGPTTALDGVVDHWLTHPEDNRGLIAMGTDEATGTWARFATSMSSVRPTPVLNVTFTAPPGAPRTAAASARDGAALVRWTTPSDFGSPILDYTVTAVRASDGATLGSEVITGATATSYRFEGLTNGVAVYFRVAARNAIGTGPAKTTGSVTPVATAVHESTIAPAAGYGFPGNGGDGGPAPLAEVDSPVGMAVDSAGRLLIATTYGVRRVSETGVISTVAGNGTCDYSGDGGPATSAALCAVADVDVDAAGNIYIADWGNSRIRKVSTSGTITTIAGTGARGTTGDGGPATSATFDGPGGVAVDAAGNLYVSEYYTQRVRKIDTSGTITAFAGTGIDGDSGDGGPATAANLRDPTDVTIDTGGNVLISDNDSGKIRKVNSAGVISTIAGNGTCCTITDGVPATSSAVIAPFAIDVDGDGNLYIADEGDDRVRKVSPSGIITTVAGNGEDGDSGDWGPATSAEFLQPTGVAAVDDGAFFVADAEAHRVRGVGFQREPIGGSLAAPEMFGMNLAELRCWVCSGDPVNTATGYLHETVTDVSVPGRGPGLTWTRSYGSALAAAANAPGPLGYGWTGSYDMSLAVEPGSGSVTVTQESGSQVTFTAAAGGGYTTLPRVLAGLVHNADGTYTFTRRARDRFVFRADGRLKQITDLNGYTTALAYDSAGRLLSATDANSRTLTFGHNASGRITSVIDPAGRVVSYNYDTAGNLTQVVDVGGGTTTYAYEGEHRLTSMRMPNGGVVSNTYDADGRVTDQTNAVGAHTTFAYTGDNLSEVGGTTTVTHPNGNVTLHRYDFGQLSYTIEGFDTSEEAKTSYVYDPATLGVITKVDASGQVTTFRYDSRGNQVTETDSLRRTTTRTFDALNDVTSVKDAENVTTTYTYDTEGNLLSESTPLAGSSPAVSRTTTYTHGDPAHPDDVTSTTDPRGKTWTKTYTAAGYLASETDPLGNKTTYTYDSVGRRLTRVSPRGNVTGGTPASYRTTYTYNAFGDVLTTTDPLGKVTTNAYDADRNRTSTTDVNGHTTTSTYDLADRLTDVHRADGTTLSRTYDGNGNLLTTRDGAGRATVYTYDALNRTTSVTDPLGRTTSFGYDANGNRTSVTDASGNIADLEYDVANQLTYVTYSDGLTPSVSFTYDDTGRRETMSDGTGTTDYTFDSLGRLTGTTNGAGASVGYGYDLSGNVTSISYPGATRTVTRTYDDAGHGSA